jgi:predicted Zn-dependent protease
MKTLIKYGLIICGLIFIVNRGSDFLGGLTDINSKDVKDKIDGLLTANEEESPVGKGGNVTFHIVGLGDYSQSDLVMAKKYVEEFYGFKCVVDGNVPTKPSMYVENSNTLNVTNCLAELSVQGQKTIYVTKEPLYSKQWGMLRGMTHMRGNTVVIKGGEHLQETVIHELGHTLGLGHCDNPQCIMAINNDAEDTGQFCSKCKNQLKNQH